MKISHTQIKHSAILGLLAVALSTSAIFAEPSENKPTENIENKDPFKTSIIKVGDTIILGGLISSKDETVLKETTAEMLNIQASIHFVRGEQNEAVEVQKQAVEKAKENVAQFTKTLSLYTGKPNENVTVLEHRLKNTIIPEVEFEDVSIEEVLETVRYRTCAEGNPTQVDPSEEFINIVLCNPSNVELNHLNMRLRNITAGALLKSIAESTGLKMRVDAEAVILEAPAP